MQELISILEVHAPEIGPAHLRAIVEAVAPNLLTRRRMFLAMQKRPGILVGQDRQVPVAVQSLAAALSAAGAASIVVPACEGCGRKMKLPHRAPRGGRHCSRCEKNYRATECASCGQNRPIHITIGDEHYCRTCWKSDARSFGVCSQCGANASVQNSLDGTLRCYTCYVPPTSECFCCKRVHRIAQWFEGKAMCPNCYYAMRYPHSCPSCSERRFLTHVVGDELRCAACAGEPDALACPGCGSVQNMRKLHLCSECRRPQIVHNMLVGSDGSIRSALRPLENYLLNGNARGDSLERWQHNSRVSAATLKDLTTGKLPLETGAIFQRCGTKQGGIFLLNLLVASGVLPDVEVRDERFNHWLTTWLAHQSNPEQRLILSRYARWGISTKPWAGHGSRPSDDTSRFRRIRGRLQICAEYLVFVEASGHTTVTLPQRTLDAYVADSAQRTDHLAHFTRWLNKNGLGKAIGPNRRQRLPTGTMTPDDRWRLARWLLHDAEVQSIDRVGGLLTLLYGQPATRIVALPRSAVTFHDQRVFLILGEDPICLPSQLATAVTELFNDPTTAHTDPDDTWLFRGRVPGQHLTAGTLGCRLSRIGISAGDARSAALLELAAEMPVALLAELLGLSIAAAARWSRAANRDWSSYPALRTEA